MVSTHADEQRDRLISPQIVLPEQFWRQARWGARESSVHRLMLGILREAVELYCKACEPRSRVSTRLSREVRAWFASRERRWLFSFERICDALGFESDYIRRGLERRVVRLGGCSRLQRYGGPPGPHPIEHAGETAGRSAAAG
ncbi:MAG TPA: hypothetical protein VMS22_21225 [Candidatus Eisenbacteria bacterium]|nr:hypothetical protein [Candidatus Eisenbacteria bacterium]